MSATLANQRWEKFTQLVSSGETGATAYRTCYGARGASAHANASRLVRNDKVRIRVDELRQQAAGIGSAEAAKSIAKAAGRAVLTLAKKRELLFALATSRKLRPEVRMKAIELGAKLSGEMRGDSLIVNATATANGYVLTEERRAELMRKRRDAIEEGRRDTGTGSVLDEEERAVLMAQKQRAIGEHMKRLALEEMAQN